SVVHLKIQRCSDLDQFSCARRIDLWLLAGSKTRQLIAPAASHRGFALGFLARFLNEDDDMVDDLAIAWSDLRRPYPLVLFEPGRNSVVLVRNDSLGRNLDIILKLDDRVRFPELPSRFKLWKGRQVFIVALRCTGVYPRRAGIDLGLRETPVILNVTVGGIGEPRRHRASNDLFFDRSGPRSDLCVREKRHRSDFTGPMTFSAAIVKDRRNVPGEGDRTVGRSTGN